MDHPGIDFSRLVTIRFGVSADLCRQYALGTPGREHLRSCPVAILPERIPHLSEDDPMRPAWLQARTGLIIEAITAPKIIYRSPELKTDVRHWSQFYAVPDTVGCSGDWVAVVLMLARFDLPRAMHHHRVLTMFRAKESYLYKSVRGCYGLGDAVHCMAWRTTASPTRPT